jgi:hypothetical protein
LGWPAGDQRQHVALAHGERVDRVGRAAQQFHELALGARGEVGLAHGDAADRAEQFLLARVLEQEPIAPASMVARTSSSSAKLVNTMMRTPGTRARSPGSCRPGSAPAC